MRTLVAVGLLLCSYVAHSADPVEPAGIYKTVSESEWEMELRLNKNHAATLKTWRWEPGEEKHPKITVLTGKWRLLNGQVEINFKKGTVLFAFDQHQSFAELEKQGEAPGLIGISGSIETDNFAGRHFWLKSELAKIKW